MSIAAPLIAELTQEAATTRRVLERVPEDQLGWKPHPRSMSLGQLALHIATLPGAVAELLREDERPTPQFVQPAAGSKAELLAALDSSIQAARRALEGWDDRALAAEWRLARDGQTVMALPRLGMVRAIMLNHWYHHRGQLATYLRLLDVPVPSIYGPTADENPFS